MPPAQQFNNIIGEAVQLCDCSTKPTESVKSPAFAVQSRISQFVEIVNVGFEGLQQLVVRQRFSGRFVEYNRLIEWSHLRLSR